MIVIVHPGTGTILDAHDGVKIVEIPNHTPYDFYADDEWIIDYAEKHGWSPCAGAAPHEEMRGRCGSCGKQMGVDVTV